MKRCLITGGTGFIGANLARRLLSDGHDVHLLVRPGHQGWRIKDINKDVTLHQIDLTRAARLSNVLRRVRPDWVFHLAAYGAYPAQKDFSQMLAVNLQGTINLLEAAGQADVAAFVNVGSSSEYGFKDHAPSEEEALVPNSDYALTKAYGSLYCQSAAVRLNMKVVTLRPYSVYGPYEEPTRLFPTLIIKGLAGKLPSLVNPETARDYIYVDDFVDACVLAAERNAPEPGAIYNVGTGRQTSLKELVALAKRYLPVKVKPRWGSMDHRIWDTNTWICDNRRMKQVFGWSPRYSVAQGFKTMIAWFKEHPELTAVYEKKINGG